MGTACTRKTFAIDPDTEEILPKNFSYIRCSQKSLTDSP